MSGSGEWWLCPNIPRCGHGRVLHDSGGDDARPPACCVQDCGCGGQDPGAESGGAPGSAASP